MMKEVVIGETKRQNPNFGAWYAVSLPNSLHFECGSFDAIVVARRHFYLLSPTLGMLFSKMSIPSLYLYLFHILQIKIIF